MITYICVHKAGGNRVNTALGKMKIYNYKEGKAVFVNNEKTPISENAALILEHFKGWCYTIATEQGCKLPAMTRLSDAEYVAAASCPEYLVKIGTVPSNGKKIIALYKGAEPLAAIIDGRELEVTRAKGLTEALANLFK